MLSSYVILDTIGLSWVFQQDSICDVFHMIGIKSMFG